MKRAFALVAFVLFFANISAQSFMWGPKGGLSVGLQTWNNIDRQPLFGPHGALFIESYREGSANSFYGQIGYHTRGSSQRVAFFNQGGVSGSFQRQRFQFNNAALVVGAKRRLDSDSEKKPYYTFGLRLDYTLSTNLDQYENSISALYFPVNTFVNKFNYGATVGFGYEFPFSHLVGGFVEANVSPDFSRQYAQPSIPNVINPFTGNSVRLPEQTIRNISLEITVGFRFLRKVIYLDDY